MNEEMNLETNQETMADYAAELEESFKAFDENRKKTYVEEEDPSAETWQELRQMQEDKTIAKVKIKEIVKGGAIAYLLEMKAFIPASQLSFEYIEKLEEWIGKSLEVRVMTADPENKRLVLSAKEVLKERREEEKNKKMEEYKAGAVVEGTVDSLQPYGAFVKLDGGVSGLLHISQISNQRIKHPGVVLKEGQQVTVKILSITDGKISLSMKALEPEEAAEESHFEYREDTEIATGLGNLLKGLKF
ncbi:MAG: S1 RNA-binding domain-containing protein [Hungatella sp.]